MSKDVDVKNWEQFARLVAEVERSPRPLLFRGVSNEGYRPISKIGRTSIRRSSMDGSSQPHDIGDERRMLAFFKRTARPYLAYQPETDLEWLAVMQHHGAPTRLLDWTESPMVAAYFALAKAGTQGRPVIYVVEAPGLASDDEEKAPFEIKGVRTYFPPHISPRIQVQRSVFTVHGIPSEAYQPEGMTRWVFPSGRPSFEMKLILDRCGFGRASLFPDLQGLAEYAGWLYKWSRFPNVGEG